MAEVPGWDLCDSARLQYRPDQLLCAVPGGIGVKHGFLNQSSGAVQHAYTQISPSGRFTGLVYTISR